MKRKITIVGLGPGDEDQLTIGALKALRRGQLILRTRSHDLVPFLEREAISFSTLDDIYEQYDNFEDSYGAMVDRIEERARIEEVALGVPGHPMVGERLVLELLFRLDPEEFEIDIIPGLGRADGVMAAVARGQTTQGVKTLIASELDHVHLDTDMATIILDVDNPLRASQVKLTLMDTYPSELRVYLCKNRGGGKLKHEELALHEVDRQEEYDHTTCLYIPPVSLAKLDRFNFNHLVRIMEILRSPEGCPWDREQSHLSLRECLLEESYEVLEAIDMGDYEGIIEELGDVLLQIVFHSRIGHEHGEFDIGDVTTGICQKMIRRHPHIFGDVTVEDSKQVLENWEEIKKEEKGVSSYTQILKDIPPILPALMRAYRVQGKAATVGFDWEAIEGAMEKVTEELGELREAYEHQDREKIDEELGDLLFSVVNIARFLKVNPELSLKGTIDKFIHRFEYMEKAAPKPLDEMSMSDMDGLWNEAKIALFEGFNV